jgi:hypothetical protein
VPFCHVPLESQVCGMFPLHVAGDVPGVHTALHSPAVTGWLTHWPALLQVCGMSPALHCVEPVSWQLVPSQHPPSQTSPPAQPLVH